MFYELDGSVEEEVIAGHEPAIDFLDAVITSHRMGNVVLVLSKLQTIRFRSLEKLSGISRKTLGLLSTKSNDYRAAMRSCERRVIVVSPTVEQNFRLIDNVVRVSYRLLGLEHLMTQKFFLAEGKRDIGLMDVLASEYLSSVGYPRSYVSFRPLLGGGGALPHVLESELVTPHKGLAVCDRDACGDVPPYGHNTTIKKTMESVCTLGLSDGSFGLSSTSPFFGIEPTWGRSIENLVGPNLLDAYFVARNRRDERSLFLKAFPQFPSLSLGEQIVWRFLNLKSGTTNAIGQITPFLKNITGVDRPSFDTSKGWDVLTIPADTIDWVIENQAAQRWTQALRRAVAIDLTVASFRQAVEAFALPLLTLAAGDSGARRS